MKENRIMLYDELKAAMQDSRKIKDLDNLDIVDVLSDQITKLISMAASKLSAGKDVTNISWSIVEDLQNNYSDMTLEELKEEEMRKANEERNISMSQSDIDMQYAREAFRRYKNGESLEMLRPPYIYKTLQDRGIIHHTREQKLEALERFKDFKPTRDLKIPEHACQYIIKSQAMAWLLKQEFDKWGDKMSA